MWRPRVKQWNSPGVTPGAVGVDGEDFAGGVGEIDDDAGGVGDGGAEAVAVAAMRWKTRPRDLGLGVDGGFERRGGRRGRWIRWGARAFSSRKELTSQSRTRGERRGKIRLPSWPKGKRRRAGRRRRGRGGCGGRFRRGAGPRRGAECAISWRCENGILAIYSSFIYFIAALEGIRMEIVLIHVRYVAGITLVREVDLAADERRFWRDSGRNADWLSRSLLSVMALVCLWRSQELAVRAHRKARLPSRRSSVAIEAVGQSTSVVGDSQLSFRIAGYLLGSRAERRLWGVILVNPRIISKTLHPASQRQSPGISATPLRNLDKPISGTSDGNIRSRDGLVTSPSVVLTHPFGSLLVMARISIRHRAS